MKHRSDQPKPLVSNDYLKANIPLWKRLFRPSIPAMTLGNVVIIIFVSTLALLAVINLRPTRSIDDYESPRVETLEFQFSDMKLMAYPGMHYEFTQSKSNGKPQGTMGGSSNEGGVRISGSITNTTNSELFLADAFPPDSFIYDDEPSFDMQLDGHPYKYITATLFSNSAFALGGQNGEFAGYYIKPNEKLNFELMEYDMTIEDEDEFILDFEWTILDPQTFERHTIQPKFHFKRNGSSIIWGSTNWRLPHFKWFRDAPVIRSN